MERTDNSKLSLFRKFHKDSFEALTINVFGHNLLTENVFKFSIILYYIINLILFLISKNFELRIWVLNRNFGSEFIIFPENLTSSSMV